MKPTELTLQRFKAIEECELRLAPLTVLIGPNNGGKSSVLHALAILGQSVDHPDVLPSGQFIDLGADMLSLVNRKHAGRGFRLKAEWEEVQPSDDPIAPGRPIRATFAYDTVPDQRGSWATTIALEAPAQRPVYVMAQNSSSGSNLIVQAHEYKTKDMSLQPATKTWLQDDLPLVMGFGRFGVPGIPGDASDGDLGPILTSTNAVISYALKAAGPYLASRIGDSLRSYRYIGADRHLSRSFYQLADRSPDLPMTADDLATVLRYNRPLREAVAVRCANFFGYRVRPELMPGKTVDIEGVSAEREAYSVVNMGAGFGQVVWIVTLLELQARKIKQGNIVPLVGLEEPELHLHPGMQPKMAELLTTYVRAGLYMVCTTQSEHLLIALLQAVARKEIDHSDLRVYYVKDGHAESLVVDELGSLSGGLKGFFEADEEELLDQLRLLIKRQEDRL